MKGYLRKLKRPQIDQAIKDINSGNFFIPQIADKYGLTVGETLSMCRAEYAHKSKIKFEKYGKKRYNFKDPIVKENLKRLIDAGNNDDEIAALWGTSYYAIARGRSTAGLVAFNRIVAKGHNSKKEFSHLETKSKQPKQGELEFAIIETDDGKRQRVVTTRQDGLIVEPVAMTKAEKEDSKIRVCLDTLNLPREVIEYLKDNITWRSIAMRMENANFLYKVVRKERNGTAQYYFRQVRVDVTNNLVTLSLSQKITEGFKVIS